MALTVRQIFYRLVARYDYEKTEQAYGRLAETLATARRARHIPMGAIRDNSSVSREPVFHADAADFAESVPWQIDAFRLDRQRGQARRLYVACEAAGMVEQLHAVADPYGVPVFSGGGFDSLTDKFRHAGKFAAVGVPVTVLRVGDYDPSGQSMNIVFAEDVGAFARELGADLEIVAVAITLVQARDRGLPSAPPKPEDRRGAHWSGDETFQAEALDPNDLAEILREAIVSRLDPVAYDDTLAEEEVVKIRLRRRFRLR